jgi:hypothetical protein
MTTSNPDPNPPDPDGARPDGARPDGAWLDGTDTDADTAPSAVMPREWSGADVAGRRASADPVGADAARPDPATGSAAAEAASAAAFPGTAPPTALPGAASLASQRDAASEAAASGAAPPASLPDAAPSAATSGAAPPASQRVAASEAAEPAEPAEPAAAPLASQRVAASEDTAPGATPPAPTSAGHAAGDPAIPRPPAAPAGTDAAPPAATAARRARIVLAGAAVALLLAGLASWALWPTSGDRAPGRAAPSATPVVPGTGGTAPQAGDPGSPSDAMGSGSPGPSGSVAPTPAKGWWRPAPGLAWQWQLKGPVDRSVDVPVYDIDAVESSAADVAALHAAGRKVICYVNAGAYEDWRPDKASFPAEVRGAELDGWPGERWLDVRRWDILGPVLSARFEVCRSKGFDAVEPDNVDGYANSSGFPLSAQDQLEYNRRLADLAHGKGLAIGLKNDVEQVAALQPHFDFAVNEECMEYDECGELRPFIAAGKPVFHVEYSTESFCTEAKGYGFSSMRKKTELDAWREPC